MKRVLVFMVAIAATFAISQPAFASESHTGGSIGTLAGPSGWCLNYTPSTATVGGYHASFGSVLNERRSVKVLALAGGLQRNTSYNVYLNELNISNGAVIGCAAGSIGSFTTSRWGGFGFFRGSGSVWVGTRSMQVMICPAFTDINASCFAGAAPAFSSAPFATPPAPAS